MPFSPNAAWVAATDSGAHDPIYFMVIDGFNDFHFSTAEVRLPTSTKKKILRAPDSIGQRLDQLSGRTSLSITSLRLLDRDGFVSELVATEKDAPFLPSLINRKVTIYCGYRSLRESEYEPVAVGQIDAITMDSTNLEYEFSIVDLKREQSERIFTNADARGSRIATSFRSAASAGAISFVLDDPANVTEEIYLYLGPSTAPGYEGNEERVQIAKVTNQTATLFGIPVQTFLANSYAAGDPIRWATTRIEGNPINLIYSILTGRFHYSTELSGGLPSLFPITLRRGEPTGLGFSPSEIDIAALIAERDNWIPNEIWSFEILQSVQGFRFLEEKLYRLLGFPYLTVDGLISFRMYRPPTVEEILSDGLPTLTKDDILSWAWERDHELHVNRVRLGLDYDEGRGKSLDIVEEEDATDQANSRETAEMFIEDSGLRRSDGGARLAWFLSGIILRRFLKPPEIFKVRVPLRKQAIDVGRTVLFSHPDIPNVKTGYRGRTNARFEVVERTALLNSDAIELTLQDPNIIRPAFFCPEDGGARADGGVFDDDYLTATDEDKEYAYWGPDEGDRFPSDGRPLYRWT